MVQAKRNLCIAPKSIILVTLLYSKLHLSNLKNLKLNNERNISYIDVIDFDFP